MKTKIMRKIYAQVVEEYNKDSHDSYYHVTDIVPSYVELEEIIPAVMRWLDVHCSNGYSSRWTNFGLNIFDEAENFVEILSRRYIAFGIE